MIEPTSEMRLAFDEAPAAEKDCYCPVCLNHRLAAVLNIAERDLTVWVTFDREESSILTVTTTAADGKQAAQEDDPGRVLRWQERRDGRFVDVGWVYEIRPFKLGDAP